MDWRVIATKLKGFQTVSSIQRILGISRRTAINYIYELRKRGFLRTTRGENKIRIYEISPIPKKRLGYPGLYNIINMNSPIKIAKPYEHILYREMPIEEAIIRAIKTKDFRTILAALALFGKVIDWSLLYKFAKKEGFQHHVGALYDVARSCIRVRRMDKRIRNKLKQAHGRNRFIIPKLKSKDFKDIEKEWKIFIPFNKSDLSKYKEEKR